jgi:peptidoglycan hydrolase-like protein with peptidoglycan-binding domain
MLNHLQQMNVDAARRRVSDTDRFDSVLAEALGSIQRPTNYQVKRAVGAALWACITSGNKPARRLKIQE